MSQLHPDELEHGTGFHALRVAAVIDETHDAKSFVLEIPRELAALFQCRAGQFLTFRIPWGEFRIARCYSLSSCPETGEPPKVTVKRVDDGRMSNWMNERLAVGDRIEVRPPAGSFLLRDSERPLCLFAGGSGITPVISLIKSALATTQRRIRLIYANRDARSVIFEAELAELARRHPGRLEVHHHLDERSGLLGARQLAALVGPFEEADFYVCGPTAYMDAVEAALEGLGVDRLRIHFERFVSAVDPDRRAAQPGPPPTPTAAPASFRLTFEKRTHDVPYLPGKTLLECAKAAGLEPPFSCEEGYCSCCMALLREGKVEMATNEALSPKDLASGFVLTCQSRPLTPEIWIDYDV
jgi:3-ketosteroid 9alpha-monooxygenase subunit B